MKGKKAHAAAAQEAWEEAGVTGKVQKKPLGRSEYEKLIPDGAAVPCSVDVYAFWSKRWRTHGRSTDRVKDGG